MIRLASIRSRATIAASSVLAATLFTAGAFAPATTHAAGETGPWQAAYVACNDVYHNLTITPTAGAVDYVSSQTIYYHFWVLDRTLNQYVTNWAPSGWGTIAHNHRYITNIAGEPTEIVIPGPVQGVASVVPVTAGHSYSVYTEYWWQTNGSWANAGAWTTSYQATHYAWNVNGSAINMCAA
jgi:hypothetical protein